MIRYIVSVDLGKSQDYTAVVIVECESNPNTATTYAVRHLERYPIGTRYEDIRDSVCALMVRPPVFGASMLALDATGVGNSVRELFEPDTLERDYHALGLLPGDHHCRMCGDEWVSVSDAIAYVRKSDADDQVARAAARVLVERGDADQRRLAASVEADHHPVLVGLDAPVDAVEQVAAVAGEAHADHGQRGDAHRRPPKCSRR